LVIEMHTTLESMFHTPESIFYSENCSQKLYFMHTEIFSLKQLLSGSFNFFSVQR